MGVERGGRISTKDFRDNSIEFIRGSKTACVTLTSPKHANKIRKLLSAHPEAGEIIWDSDGILTAHIPTNWIRFSAPREMTEEQKKAASERMAAFIRNRKGGGVNG